MIQTGFAQLTVLIEQDYSPKTKKCFSRNRYDLVYGLLCSKDRSENFGAALDFFRIHLVGQDSRWANLVMVAIEIILAVQDTIYKLIDPHCPSPLYHIPTPTTLEKRQFGLRDMLFTLNLTFCNKDVFLRLAEEQIRRHLATGQNLGFNIWGARVFQEAWCCFVTDIIDDENL